ncbi:enoyl-CoA hydratase/carnithine racemase [Actinomadura hallensis]|uniref:Enoyl-CoA hydratase/carnithine racemase n=1 Tax=Actinomadura hallensis TaxID=337895 RepID=A0A543IAZ0_9ACTN|nr:crotonase/enoyl-CoA hydratase family protein [Actinomadura hallensis]TQM67701.1 enoyl-CoA hydratase/carnithine racemase [Actinomadura hallensis]HLV74619.1 crotonase/enoyl-CoA hydratase family protein [Vulgatibacteraceae bacterium]
MPYTEIEYEVRDRIATVTLNRPQKMNAFTFTMRDELLDVFDRIDADDDVRAVVVTGAGRAFCAGADLSAGGDTFDKDKAADLITGEGDRLEDGTPRDGGGMVALRIARCLKPVIGAFNGAAVGVGVTMTLPMDVRLASEKAKFGFVFARRGIVAEAASSWFLPRLVGIAQAMEWAATGRVFDAREALEGRLVSRVLPPDELLPAAYALAREIADNTSAVSVAAIRRLMWSGLSAPSPWDAHAADSRLMAALGGAADAVEGVTSFLEKRDAEFPMRVGKDLPPEVPDWPAR